MPGDRISVVCTRTTNILYYVATQPTDQFGHWPQRGVESGKSKGREIWRTEAKQTEL